MPPNCPRAPPDGPAGLWRELGAGAICFSDLQGPEQLLLVSHVGNSKAFEVGDEQAAQLLQGQVPNALRQAAQACGLEPLRSGHGKPSRANKTREWGGQVRILCSRYTVLPLACSSLLPGCHATIFPCHLPCELLLNLLWPARVRLRCEVGLALLVSLFLGIQRGMLSVGLAAVR